MDVCLHHGAVDAELVDVVDLGGDGVPDENYVDPPGHFVGAYSG
jgi:hypothetical protein